MYGIDVSWGAGSGALHVVQAWSATSGAPEVGPDGGEVHCPVTRGGAVDAQHDRTIALLLAHHEHRTPGVRRQIHRRGPHQQPDESAHAPGTHYHQLGGTRLRLQGVNGSPVTTR